MNDSQIDILFLSTWRNKEVSQGESHLKHQINR